ncbi:MAG TPA: hypothetical protein VI731_06030 [Bacteroidia bacterium]|nr:hypothetical protein [Bacteroidia bacterium]
MKNVLVLIVLILPFAGCHYPTGSPDQEKSIAEQAAISPIQKAVVVSDTSFENLSRLFSLKDAESILGEPVHLSDSSSGRREAIFICKKAFIANRPDTISGKTGAVYFMIEHYNNLIEAKQKYASIKKANRKHKGIKVLNDVGDEAYFHSDGENFYFILVRKFNRVLTMKVNKITTYTSLDAFNAVARRIAAAL